MEVEQLYEEQRHLLEDRDPLLGLAPPVTITQRPIRIFLALISLMAVAIISTAAAEIDVSYLLICFHQGIDREECFQSPEASVIVSSLTLYANIIQALGGIFVTPTLTAKSDIYGRKLLFIWSGILTLCAQVLKWWLVFGTEGTPHYYWMLAPLCVATMGGGVGIFAPMAVSYISDLISDAKERAQYVSFVEASLFIAIAAGPTLGSTFISWYGLSQLYFASSITLALVIVLIYLFVVESLSSTQAELNKAKSPQNLIGNCKMLLYRHIPDPQRRRTARLFTVCSILGTEFMLAVINVMFMYVKRKFNWTAVKTGYFITTTSSNRFIAYVAGFPYLYKKFSSWWPTHSHDVDRVDLTFLRIALGLCATGFFFMTFASTPTTFVVSALVESSASFANPIYRSALIKYAPDGQFGSFMGSVSLVTSIMALIFPTALIKVYGATVNVWPGLAFLLISGAFASLFASSYLVKAKS